MLLPALPRPASPAPPVALERRERNAEETRRRILDAAETEFAAKGFDGARLAHVARAAGVQAALIHHYFSDKDGLYREVLTRALEAMGKQGESLLAELARGFDASEIRPLTRAFAHLLVEFYATHAPLVAILRHDAAREGETSVLRSVVASHVKPVFDAMVTYIEGMKRRGLLRADVHARHLCISALGLAAVPIQEEELLHGVWSVDVRSPEFLAEREREIVEMVLSRVLPKAKKAARVRAAAPGRSASPRRGSRRS